jgi:hypothetical protein
MRKQADLGEPYPIQRPFSKAKRLKLAGEMNQVAVARAKALRNKRKEAKDG